MKREREVDSITMTNLMMFVSHGGEFETNYYNNSSNNHVFECKTCKRWFPSFQALGGHRASHKKPRLMMMARDRDIGDQLLLNSQSLSKPKTHECSICGLEFALGQALGGHMRRHRTSNLNGNMQNATTRVLDLNLTPFENDLKVLKIGKKPTLVEYL